MRSLRRLAPAAVLLLSPVLVACGGDDGDGDDRDTTTDETTTSAAPSTEASDSTDDTSETPGEGGDGDGAGDGSGDGDGADQGGGSAGSKELLPACDVLPEGALEAVFPVTFGEGRPGTGDHAENELAWASDRCSWEAEDLMEVTLYVSSADDFTPKFKCPTPTGIGTDVTPLKPAPGPGVATKAWWVESEQPPLEASLRACTRDALVEIELEYEDGTDYEGDPQEQATNLLSVVLASLFLVQR